MGDPRKQRKKYDRPPHPWQKARIDEEKLLSEEYGLKNKKDLWRMTSKLARFKQQAKALIARQGEQAEKEKSLFLTKLHKLNLVQEAATLDHVLDLSVKDLLERRLQTVVFRQGLSRTIKQARQMIVHEHIMVNNQKVNVPSFLVTSAIESSIEFHGRSNFIDPEHPERKQPEPVVEEVKVETKTEETKEEVKAPAKEEETKAPAKEEVKEKTEEATA
tara:strand:- start:9831 stop:10484 length:654 start_codon:yes stop_codon:yes gene_type:complete